MFIAALEAVEPSVSGSERRGRNQSGQGRRGGVFDRPGQRGPAQGGDEPPRARFEIGQAARRVFRRFPGIAESGAVMVSNEVVLVTLRRFPPAPPRSTVGKMPAQKERILRFAARPNLALEADRAYRTPHRRFGSELPVGGEVVPEE